MIKIFRSINNPIQSVTADINPNFGSRKVAVGKKSGGVFAKDTLPVNLTASQNKLSVWDRLDRQIFKLLSALFNPKSTLEFQDLLSNYDVNERKAYEELVDDLLARKDENKGDLKPSLAFILKEYKKQKNPLIAVSDVALGRLAYLLATDPRTKNLFKGSKILTQKQQNTIDEAVGNKRKEVPNQKTHQDINRTFKAIGQVILNTKAPVKKAFDEMSETFGKDDFSKYQS